MLGDLNPIYRGGFWLRGAGGLQRFVQDNVAPSLALDFKNGIYASDDTGSWAQSRAEDGIRPSLVLDFNTPQYGGA